MASTGTRRAALSIPCGEKGVRGQPLQREASCGDKLPPPPPGSPRGCHLRVCLCLPRTAATQEPSLAFSHALHGRCDARPLKGRRQGRSPRDSHAGYRPGSAWPPSDGPRVCGTLTSRTLPGGVPHGEAGTRRLQGGHTASVYCPSKSPWGPREWARGAAQPCQGPGAPSTPTHSSSPSLGVLRGTRQ